MNEKYVFTDESVEYEGHTLYRLGEMIRNGEFVTVDVTQEVKNEVMSDWLLRESRIMLEKGCNVLQYGEILTPISTGENPKVRYKTMYLAGKDENGEPVLSVHKPQDYVYGGTHSALCPVRVNGLVQDGSMVVVGYKDSVCIIVDNQEDYDKALLATCGTERKIVQVHDESYLSVLDAVKLAPKDSNLVVVHSGREFEFIDEHVFGKLDRGIDKAIVGKQDLNLSSLDFVPGQKALGQLRRMAVVHSSFNESLAYMAKDMISDFSQGKTVREFVDSAVSSIREHTEGDYQKVELLAVNDLVNCVLQAEGRTGGNKPFDVAGVNKPMEEKEQEMPVEIHFPERKSGLERNNGRGNM